MEFSIKNPAFAAKMALTYVEFFDGISPLKQRVSMRVNGRMLELKNVETMVEYRWSLDEMRVLEGQADDEALVFAPDNHGAARMVVREVEAMKAIIDSGAALPAVSGAEGSRLRLGIISAIAAACFGGLLFGLIPWFADAAAERIPPEAEIALGQQHLHMSGISRMGPPCTNPGGLAALNAMTDRLTADANLHLPLTVSVVDHDMVNAFALAGGHVVLVRGLIEAANDPNEVAGILAHEIGHVAHRDATRSQIRAMASYGMIGLVFADAFGVATTAFIGQAINNNYTRAAEIEADTYAHNMMIDANFSPEALGQFFARMESEHGASPGGLAGFIATHPGFADRVNSAAAAGRTQTAPTASILNETEWASLQAICTAGAPANTNALPPSKR